MSHIQGEADNPARIPSASPNHGNSSLLHPFARHVSKRRDKIPGRAVFPLTMGAIGVVFGDIGTSPLYTLKAVITAGGGADFSREVMLGLTSMIIWCLIIIVTVTYVGIILRADNQGEGGILSLAALIKRKVGAKHGLTPVVIATGVIGASLFLGDSMITPAITVLSAAEGLTVINPDFARWVVPIALILLAGLFAVQRHGTGKIGVAFGPIMSLWFICIGALGVPWIISDPSILSAFNPMHAVHFAVGHPLFAFLALGASVLAVTGAEALYADLGHFGRLPIILGWMLLAFPALILNYLGQSAMLLQNPSALDSPLFQMAPAWALIPLILLATAATIIASQSVISGAFSIVRQAIRLSLLPRLKIVQTSVAHGGQIYLPAVNLILFLGVTVLVTQFRSSERLAVAYGLAVTGTLLLELILFLVFARFVWRWSAWKLVALAAVTGTLELALFLANASKFLSGGWLPITISASIAVIMFTWNRGSKIMFGKRTALEGPLTQFIECVNQKEIRRVPGVAIYPHGDPGTTPLALRVTVNFSDVLHEHVVIVTVKNLGVPHVSESERIVVDELGWADDGIVQILYKVGFNDPQDIPGAVQLALHKSPELEFDLQEATYFLSVFRIEPADEGEKAPWPHWQRELFRRLERTSTNRTQVFHLPPERTVVVGSEVHV